MSTIQADIEATLAEAEPEVEVLLAELDGDTVELYIDHPDGVTLDLCERVTNALPELLGATDDAITVAADTGVVSIAYDDIHRSNLLGD